MQCIFTFAPTNGDWDYAGMNYLRQNVKYLSGLKGVDQKNIGAAIGVDQSTISRATAPNEPNTGYQTIQKLAAYFGVTMDDLVSRNIAEDGVSSQSQARRLDEGKLGTALTSIDRALAGEKIQGRLGTLAGTLIAALGAQEKHFPNGVPEESRAIYDDLVAGFLERGSNERRRLAGENEAEGTKGNSRPAAKKKEAGASR